MRKLYTVLIFFLALNVSFSQSIVGVWSIIDDDDKKEKSQIKIYEMKGKFFGKIVKIINPKEDGDLCKKCPGEKKNKPILDMVILENLKKNDEDNRWDGGEITNPDNGKIYKCYIKLLSEDKLKIRGYVAFPVLGKTQHWQRLK